jgi:hypothetical protein
MKSGHSIAPHLFYIYWVCHCLKMDDPDFFRLTYTMRASYGLLLVLGIVIRVIDDNCI